MTEHQSKYIMLQEEDSSLTFLEVMKLHLNQLNQQVKQAMDTLLNLHLLEVECHSKRQLLLKPLLIHTLLSMELMHHQSQSFHLPKLMMQICFQEDQALSPIMQENFKIMSLLPHMDLINQPLHTQHITLMKDLLVTSSQFIWLFQVTRSYLDTEFNQE